MARADFAGQLIGFDTVARYVFGGHARFTVVSKKTGTRYTYRLSLPNSKCKNCGEPLAPGARDCGKCAAPQAYPAPDPSVGPFFLKVLTGPDNEAAFEFVGTVRLRDGYPSYTHSRKARIGETAPSVVAAKWFFAQLAKDAGSKLDACEIFHDGTCCRCGRALTVPESVASGIGPICAEKGL